MNQLALDPAESGGIEHKPHKALTGGQSCY